MNSQKPIRSTFLQSVADFSRSYILKKVFKRFTSRIRKNKSNVSKLHKIFSQYSKTFAGYSVLDIIWLDQDSNNCKAELLPAYDSVSYGPKLNGAKEIVSQVRIAAIKQYFFHDAQINITSSSVVSKSEAIIERVQGVSSSRSSYVSGHITEHGATIVLVDNICEPIIIEKAIFLGGNGCANYYHWLIEILPKLEYIDELSNYTDYPLLVSEDVCSVKNLRDALNALNPDRAIVSVKSRTNHIVQNLVYINAPNECPFNLQRKQVLLPSDFYFRKSSIDYIRRKLIQNVHAANASKRQRIFMARRPGRRDYNQDQVFSILEPLGFHKVFMEELSFHEQIELMSNAEFIAGPTGAAWTNLVFCRPGTKCLCWMADESAGFSAFSNLAVLVGADMHYVTYRAGVTTTGKLYFQNYTVDASAIKKQIESMISDHQ